MKGFLKVSIKYLVVSLILFVGGWIVLSELNTKTLFNMKYVLDGTIWLVVILGDACLLLYDMFRVIDGKTGKKKEDHKSKDSKGNKVDQFFNRDFVTEQELKTNKAYNYNTLSTIRSCKKDGILVRAHEKGGNMDINFVKPIHTLVVGTTSSGKTRRFVVPSLQIMSMTAAKPSFIVTDPKAELYNLNAKKLKDEGYDVKVLDLREPSKSIQWNPLIYPYDMYTRSFNLDQEVRVHQAGDNPKQYNLIIEKDFDYTITPWFEFNGNAFVDQSVLESEMRIVAKELRDKTDEAVQDICATLSPIENGKDPSWEKTARRLIQAVITAMLEDSQIPELGLTREKFNFYNVYKIVNTTDSGRETYATLKKYLFNYRDKFSKVPDLASTALQNADTTSKNYMGFASGMVSLFADSGISFLTEKTEIDFIDIDEKPTVVFLIIPDEIRIRYPLAILFVTQLYKRLVTKAQSLGGELKRHVYFLLDEFGNMPKFPEFSSIMTVGRARGIFFELCVQSYSQLYQVYGQEEGKIIKENCPIQVYVSTEDMTTNKEFSELLGKKTIYKENVTKSKGADGKDNNTTSEQELSIPIAYPEELMSFRDKGQVVFKTFEPNACIKTEMTHANESKIYDLSPMFGSFVQRRAMDEESVFYDIKDRNKVLADKHGDTDDDDDDLF